MFSGRAGLSFRHSASQTRVNALMAPLDGAARQSIATAPMSSDISMYFIAPADE